MLTDDWYPTLAQAERRADRRPDRGITRDRRAHRRRPERAADALVLATGFKAHDFVAPMEIAGADGHTLAEEWGAGRAPTSGSPSRASRTCSCSTGPTPTAAPARDRDARGRRWRHVLAALGALDRRRADDRGPPRGRRGVRPRAAPALARTVWHTGCTNWYVDETATTRTSGRGRGASTGGAPRGSTRGVRVKERPGDPRSPRRVKCQKPMSDSPSIEHR